MSARRPNHALAMGALGYLLIVYEYNWSKGIQLLEAAVDLAPDNALVIAGYGLVLLITGHESATVTERGHRLDPLQPTNILFRAIQLAMDGQQVQALSLMDTALIAHSKGYTANYQVARFNAQAGRLSKAEKHLALAKMIVGPEYPALKVVEYMIARRRGDEQTAEQLKSEIYSLMRSERVPFLLEVDWNREELAVVLETALQQKSGELLGIFLQGRHPLTSEAQWKEYQSRINFSEADIGTLRPPFHRNQEEVARLLTEASHLSDEQLSQYVGSYKRENDGFIITIVLENGRLQYTWPRGVLYLVPAGEHEFKILSRRFTINFGVSNQNVNTMNLFLELEERTIVAVKVDQE